MKRKGVRTSAPSVIVAATMPARKTIEMRMRETLAVMLHDHSIETVRPRTLSLDPNPDPDPDYDPGLRTPDYGPKDRPPRNE